MRYLIPFAFLLAACGTEEPATSDEPTPTPEDLEIIGSWIDDFDGTHEITAHTWTMAVGGVFHIDEFDNTEMVLFAENDSGNEFNPDLWSRMDWTWDGDDLYFCQTAYNAADKADAMATPAADGSDLTAGCGGFGWSGLMSSAM